MWPAAIGTSKDEMKIYKLLLLLFLLSQTTNANKIPNKLAVKIQEAIEKEGGRIVLNKIFSTPEWDSAMVGISNGSPTWLKVAGKLRPFSDAASSEDLSISIGIALGNNPTAVFNEFGRADDSTSLSGYCKSMPIEDTLPHLIQLFEKRKSALTRSKSIKWRAHRADCLKEVNLELEFLRNQIQNENAEKNKK